MKIWPDTERPVGYPAAEADIVWLTGWSMSDSVFEPIWQELPEFRHISVAYREAETPEQMKTTVMEKTQQFRRDRVPLLVAGWSLGAVLALGLAAEQPTDGLVLFAGTACFVRDERELGWPRGYVRRMMAALRGDRDSVLKSFRQSMFAEPERASLFTGSLEEMDGDWSPQALLAGLKLLSDEDVRLQLPSIVSPALLFHGNADGICPYGAAGELQKAMSDAHLVTMEGGDHVPFFGNERITAQTIRKWWHERTKERHTPAI